MAPSNSPVPMTDAGTSAQAKATYAKVAATYDEGYRSPRWDVYDHVTRATFAPWLPPPGGRVLDAGAGTGKWALEFLARGDHVTLLDPAPEMLDVARGKVAAAGLSERAAFVVGGIDRIELPDASFDFVFCEGDPLSYCDDRHGAAREILRVLRPGGAFYASCDSRWYAALIALASGDSARLEGAVQDGRSADPYGAPVHAFHPQELRDLFAGIGAVDVRVLGKVSLLNFVAEQRVGPLLADPAFRERVLEVETRMAADPASAGLAGHLQVVGRKPQA